MIVSRAAWVALLALPLSLSLSPRAQGDIYRYVDEKGVIHFTNIKTDSRYKLYLRASRKSASVYIKDYGDIILEASKRFNVELSLIKAVIKAESDFDHQAVSPKGAKGLMQLMPQTAQEMDVEDSFDPQDNILGGTRYLSLLLERFKNDKILALAAYNAGTETVESFNGVPPFPETKAFVERVINYYRAYNSDVLRPRP
ncbi:MAG: lytic transglycosylase domain-containing protein [Pseudomonadota bacterium]